MNIIGQEIFYHINTKNTFLSSEHFNNPCRFKEEEEEKSLASSLLWLFNKKTTHLQQTYQHDSASVRRGFLRPQTAARQYCSFPKELQKQAARKYGSPLTAQNAVLALFSLPTDGSMEPCQKGSWFVYKESFSHYFNINCNSCLTSLLSPVTYSHMIRTLNFNVLYVVLRHFLEYFLIILFVFMYSHFPKY